MNWLQFSTKERPLISDESLRLESINLEHGVLVVAGDLIIHSHLITLLNHRVEVWTTDKMEPLRDLIQLSFLWCQFLDHSCEPYDD